MTPGQTTDEIIKLVAKFHLVPPGDIKSRRRTPGVVEARYHAIRVVHEAKPWMSSTELGRVFNRHHSTILYALNRLKLKPTV